MNQGFCRPPGNAASGKALSAVGGRGWIAICMICVTLAAATARGQSSQPAGDEPVTPQTIQKMINRLMSDYDQRQRRADEEHARQVAEYDREVAEQRQNEIDAASQPSRLTGLWVFLLVVAAFWIYLVIASVRRQRVALQRSQRMIELLESIDRRLPGPPAPPPSSPVGG